MKNSIELIPVDILDKYPALSSELDQLGRSLALSSGWHYALDWTWVTSKIGEVGGKTILDAGAGIGLMQWYLASKRANIISVDRSDRRCIPFHLLRKFNVKGYRPQDNPLTMKEIINITNGKASLTRRLKTTGRGFFGSLRSFGQSYDHKGTVRFLNVDLGDLSLIPANSVDIVVSISALEHNKRIENIKNIIQELERVLAPGGMMLITLSAAAGKDCFFSPAYSWCLTDATLRKLFDFDEGLPSNFYEYENFSEKLKKSEILRKNMSLRYYFQPNSGMPWGKWDPKYLPVGIVKIKQV